MHTQPSSTFSVSKSELLYFFTIFYFAVTIAFFFLNVTWHVTFDVQRTYAAAADEKKKTENHVKSSLSPHTETTRIAKQKKEEEEERQS